LAASLTRIGMMRKFQPRPLTPTPLLPAAAAQPATCVPWPWMSVRSPPSTSAMSLALLKPGTRLARSSWGTMPVSVTAMMISLAPSARTMSHASGDFIIVWCHCSG